MNCVESRLLLHAHVDAELDVANSRELERHLQSCPACSAAQNSLQSLLVQGGTRIAPLPSNRVSSFDSGRRG